MSAGNSLTPMTTGMLDPQALEALIRNGSIDTVLVAFTDLQGRLIGKRVTGHFYLDHVASGEGAIEACVYLLAVDVDMTPLPGYEFANWETGYGDFRCVPDPTTLRVVPWLEKTALVLCDLYDEESGEPVAVSPRQILIRQVERAAALGYRVKCASELEFFLFRESYEEAQAKQFQDLTPHSGFIEDYHILQTTRDEYLIRQIRNGMDGAGVPVEFSKGEAGKGQHEINLRYADAVTMADRHVIYKNGAKEIAGLNGRSLTFMAKYSMDDVGSSCHVHSSLWDAGRHRVAACGTSDRHRPHVRPRSAAGSAASSPPDASWRGCSPRRSTPTSATSRSRGRPTALAWGRDNRTCGFRLVGHGQGFRIESRIPGADCNPYLAFAATIAAGPARHREQDRAASDARRQRVRRTGHPPRPVEHRRRDRRVRAQ